MSEASEILREMLNAVPNSYQKTIGFPTWDWLAAAAIPINGVEKSLEQAKLQLDPANLIGDALDAYIFPRTGQRRTAATYAEGEVTVTGTGTVPEGSLFESGGGVQFAATETVTVTGSGIVPVRCTAPGAVGNLPGGSITMMPVQIAGISAVTNLEPTTGGYEQESDEAFYQRFLIRVQTPPTSGNQYHYLEWALEVAGVGGVQIYPLDKGDNTVGVVILDAFGMPADTELVEQVQTHIDPDSLGLGEGEAPIGAHCYVSAAAGQELTVSLTVTTEAGADQETVTSSIKEAAKAYLAALALEAYTPKVGAVYGYTVSYARLGAAILDVPGVTDYHSLTVNGETENIAVAAKSAAVLGEVTVSYESG